MEQENPFSTPMIKGFVLFVISIGLLVTIVLVMFGLILDLSEDQMLGVITPALTLIPVLWFVLITGNRNISYKTFFQSTFRTSAWQKLWFVVPLFALSVGIFWLFFYLFYLINPEWAAGYFSLVDYEIWPEEGSIGTYILLGLSIVILAPVVEEILFRGFILHRLSVKYNVTAAIIISSLLFGILHPGGVLSAFAFGVIASLIYIYSRSLYLPIALHAVYNGMVLSLFIFFPDVELFANIEQVYSQAWIGAAFLLAGLPWFFWFLTRYRISEALALPAVVPRRSDETSALPVHDE